MKNMRKEMRKIILNVLFAMRYPLIKLLGKKYLPLITIATLLYCVFFGAIEINQTIKIVLLSVLLTLFIFEWYLFMVQRGLRVLKSLLRR